jgi:hypothetical protein
VLQRLRGLNPGDIVLKESRNRAINADSGERDIKRDAGVGYHLSAQHVLAAKKRSNL